MTELPPAGVEPYGLRVEPDGAFEQVPVDDALRDARERRRRVVVLAPHGQSVDDFCETHDLVRRRVVYATPGSVRGYSDPVLVVLPGFHDNPGVGATWTALGPAFAARPR